MRTQRNFAGCLLAVVLGVMPALPLQAQTGHPAKGSWLGYYGPDADAQQRIRLLLDWQDRELRGVINPGRNSIDIESISIDYANWTLTLEAAMPDAAGATQRFVAVGVLDNLGSWTNRRYQGTYTLGRESGEFLFYLN